MRHELLALRAEDIGALRAIAEGHGFPGRDGWKDMIRKIAQGTVRIVTRRRKYDWDAVDWGKSNIDIAAQTGAPVEYVSHVRHLRRNTRGRVNRDWTQVDWSIPTTDLAKQYAVTVSRISNLRRKHAPDSLGATRLRAARPRVDWSRADWSLSDSQLAKKVGVSRQAVHSKRRKMTRES